MISKFLLSLALVFMFQRAEAHPVSYVGSNSIMTWNSKESSDWMFTHTYTHYFSLSAHYVRMDDKKYYFPSVNFLVKRWNEVDSQANIYFSAGHGNASFGAVEADWESRKYYVSFKEEALVKFNNKTENNYYTRVRAGFAPYLAEYNELNSWFILQMEKQSKSKDEYTLTPMIRLFYRNVLTEFGVSHKGDAQFNFMVHF